MTSLYFAHFLRTSRIDYSLTQNEIKSVKSVIILLENRYFQICESRNFPPPFKTLIYDLVTLNHLYSIVHEYGFDDLHESFSNYIHAMINGDEKPKEVLKHFSFLFTDESGYESFIKVDFHLNNPPKREKENQEFKYVL
jgi:hypothetical protein